MASYTNVPDSVLEPGDPIRSVDIIAIKDNIEHYAENNGTTTVFNAPGTWTKPATVKRIKVTVVGGGGSALFTPGPTSPGATAPAGGTSSFGAFVSATGGGGAKTPSPSNIGPGGTGSNGDLNFSGKRGESTINAAGGAALGFSNPTDTVFTQNGFLYGGGGAVANNSFAGGAGAAIRWIPAPSIPGPVTVTRGDGAIAVAPSPAAIRANGANGVVIVEEFY
jgi:hypothetical protein